MKFRVIDTNVIIRFFVGDNVLQHKQAEKIFRDAELGKIKIKLLVLVIAESVYVLESFYKREREEIKDFFEVLLSQKWLTVESKEILRGVWDWYLKGFHFVDSYLLAYQASKSGKIISFDKKLMKIAGK